MGSPKKKEGKGGDRFKEMVWSLRGFGGSFPYEGFIMVVLSKRAEMERRFSQ